MRKYIIHIIALLSVIMLAFSCQDDLGISSQMVDKVSFDVNAERISSEELRARRSAAFKDYKVVPIKVEGSNEQLYLQAIEYDTITASPNSMRDTRMAEINNDNFKKFAFFFCPYGAEENWKEGAPIDSKISEVQLVGDKWKTEVSWDVEKPKASVLAFAPINADEYGLSSWNGKTSVKDMNPVFEQQGTPDRQVDLLYAVKNDIPVANHETIHLKFKHLLTEVRFYVGSGLLKGMTIKSIGFEGIAKSATYKVNDEVASDQPYGEWKNHKKEEAFNCKYEFESDYATDGKQEGTEISRDEIRFRMIPQDLADVKLKIVYNWKGQERTAEIPMKGMIKNGWQQGRSVWITLSNSFDPTNNFDVEQGQGINKYNEGDKIKYKSIEDGAEVEKPNVEGSDITLDDWFKINSSIVLTPRAFGEEVKIPIAYKVEYKKKEEPDSEYKTLDEFIKANPRWVLTGIEGCDDRKVLDGKQDIITLFRNRNIEEQKSTIELREKPGVKDYDLSTKGGTKSQNTANCYVVNAAGTYRLPLVYGNAIKDGAPNPSAYTATLENSISGANGTKEKPLVLKNFLDYKGNAISSPNISGAHSADLLWEDEPNLIYKVSLSEDKKELCFEITKQAICQGNAVLAIKDKDGKVMWNWHIWVINYELGNGDIRIFNHRDKVTGRQYSNMMMKYNIGYCEKDENQGNVKDRIFTVRVTQIRPKGDVWKKILPKPGVRVFDVRQKGGTDIQTLANSCMYQWGRKDPFPGLLELDSVKKIIIDKPMYRFDEVGRIKVEKNGGTGPYDYQYSIQHPTTFLTSKDIKFDKGAAITYMSSWAKKAYWNLWNNKNNDWATNYLVTHLHTDLNKSYRAQQLIVGFEAQIKEIIDKSESWKKNRNDSIEACTDSIYSINEKIKQLDTNIEKWEDWGNLEDDIEYAKILKGTYEIDVLKYEEKKKSWEYVNSQSTYQLKEGIGELRNKIEEYKLLVHRQPQIRNEIKEAQEKYAYLHDVVKTIYDPSPVGYCVPVFDAFTGFTPTGLYDVVDKGDNPYLAKDEKEIKGFYANIYDKETSEVIEFPITSYRDGYTGELATPAPQSGLRPFITYDAYYFTSGYMFATRPSGEFSFNNQEISPCYASFMTDGRCIRPMKEGATELVENAKAGIDDIDVNDEDHYIHIDE